MNAAGVNVKCDHHLLFNICKSMENIIGFSFSPFQGENVLGNSSEAISQFFAISSFLLVISAEFSFA